MPASAPSSSPTTTRRRPSACATSSSTGRGARRATFVYQIEKLEDSLRRAREITEGPVILLDHYDNCASGGTMDTMTVLGAILEAGLENVAVFAIHDPAAVQQMIASGIGATVTLALGGKLDMPAIHRTGEPLAVTGKVKLIADGRYRNRGPMGRGVLVDMGPTVVLDTGKVEIVVITRHVEPNDLGCFLSLGIDPLTKRYLMLKSRIHYRAGFKADRQGDHRMRRHRRLHLGLWPASVPQCPSADLPARSRQRPDAGLVSHSLLSPRREETRDRDRPSLTFPAAGRRSPAAKGESRWTETRPNFWSMNIRPIRPSSSIAGRRHLCALRADAGRSRLRAELARRHGAPASRIRATRTASAT